MNVTIQPRLLKGNITPPASKSQGHRALLAAALAQGESVLAGLTPSRDIEATISCVCTLGAQVRWEADGVHVAGRGSKPGVCSGQTYDCGESGSTLRFLIPITLALTGGGSFIGHGRLMERPLQPYFDIFKQKDIYYAQADGRAGLEGTLTPGDYSLPGNVSSQFITGLLFALPLLDGDSRLLLTTPLESEGYVDMTLEVLEQFGIRVIREDNGFLVPGGQSYQSRDVRIESDWSQAAFWYAARALGSEIAIDGLNAASAQGDRVIAAQFEQLTAPGEVELDMSQCPDLVPALAAMAAVRRGTTRIVNAARLRIKESDRLAAVTDVLSRLGADVSEQEDGLTIVGKTALVGGVCVDSHNDHRIAMMAAVAATRCQGPVTVENAGCVAKSYPSFWEDYETLGGRIVRS